MEPISAVIGGGMSLLGGIMANEAQADRDRESFQRTAAFNAAEAEKSRTFSAEQAQQQIAFQERMSSSAYQRAMQDMKLSGLNPILAYQKGGASSPSGAMGQSSAASAPAVSSNVHDVLTPAFNSAMAAMRGKAEIDNMVETGRLTRAQTATELFRPAFMGSQMKHLDTDNERLYQETYGKYLQNLQDLFDYKVRSSEPGKAGRAVGVVGGDVSKIVPPVGLILGGGGRGTVSARPGPSAKRGSIWGGQ